MAVYSLKIIAYLTEYGSELTVDESVLAIDGTANPLKMGAYSLTMNMYFLWMVEYSPKMIVS